MDSPGGYGLWDVATGEVLGSGSDEGANNTQTGASGSGGQGGEGQQNPSAAMTLETQGQQSLETHPQ